MGKQESTRTLGGGKQTRAPDHGRKPRTLGVGELGWATRKTDTEATMDVRRLLGVGVIIIAGCMERRVYNK